MNAMRPEGTVDKLLPDDQSALKRQVQGWNTIQVLLETVRFIQVRIFDIQRVEQKGPVAPAPLITPGSVERPGGEKLPSVRISGIEVQHRTETVQPSLPVYREGGDQPGE